MEEPAGAPPSLQEVMDDLALRFVVNAPSDQQETFERLLFQVEAAYWFYDDEYREIWPHVYPSLSLLQFSKKLFNMCELLAPYASETEKIYKEFTAYKYSIPTCGAIIVNRKRTKVVLVRGFKSKTWGFPKGKIDADEEMLSCAVREVYEEVGFDITPHIDSDRFIEKQPHGFPLCRLYVALDVPEDTKFQTQTKKEIGGIAWHEINKIAAFRGVTPFLQPVSILR